MTATATPPTRPGRGHRWQPVRAGLVNVWRYAEEVFTFHEGRVLLRGANGSGKSMALELLFPFLLDANAQPGRLSSAGKSRGGLYERLMAGLEGRDRVGFLWAELARHGEDGDQTFTIGVRLRASSATRKVDYAWFTTTRAVGRDLELFDEHRIPLSKAGLDEALAGTGTVHSGADDYRRTVRTTLFPGCDERQYDAAITTLLALRREKISQDLNPEKLSNVLGASLPPLDEYDIAEVAEGFEKLERRKDDLERLEADLGQVRRLGRRQRTYARAVLADVAQRVRAATTRRDDVTRRERQAAEALAGARAEVAAVETDDAAAARRAGELRAEVDALKSLDAYRAGGQIELLRGEAERAGRRASDEAEAALARCQELAGREEALDERRQEQGDASAAVGRAGDELVTAADPAGAMAVVEEATTAPVDEAETLLTAWTEGRRRQLTDVRHAVAVLGRAIDGRDRAERVLEEERSAFVDASGRRDETGLAVEAAVAGYTAAVSAWASSCTGLDAVALGAALPSPPEDPVAVAAAVGEVAATARSTAAVAADRLTAALAAADEDAADLGAERAELAAGRVGEPDVPAWRSPRPPERPGAPFWRLVDVADGVGVAGLEGVEAALLASGLLDAWVMPDGEVTMPGEADMVLSPVLSPVVCPGDGPTVADGDTTRSLAHALVPAELDAAPVPAPVVSALLGAISLVASVHPDHTAGPAIGLDGTFRIGPLLGRGAVRPAAFVGAAAQEQRRARRLGELDEQLGELARSRAVLQRQLDDLRREQAALEAEVGALPGGEAIERAERALAVAEERVADARARVDRSEAARSEAEAAARVAQRDLMRLGAASGLPTEAAGLEELDSRLRAIERLAPAWSHRRRQLAACERAARRAEDDVARAAAELERAEGRSASAAAEHQGLSARLSALEESVGAEYRDVVARIGRAGAEVAGLDERRVAHGRRLRELAGEMGRLEADLEKVEAERLASESERDEAGASFQAAVNDGLAADAEVELAQGESGVSAVLDAARTVASALGASSPQEVDRRAHQLQESLHQARQSLGGGIELVLDQADGGWWVLRAVSDGLRRRVGELAGGLADALAAARDELRDEEHRLFDETLTGSVRRAVAERIRRSNALVDGINAELAEVRTAAAGVGVRLRWEVHPDQPEAVKAARRLLLKDPADLGEGERASLYGFFRARLDDARQALDGTAGWEERLRDALDYRRWHHFALEVAHRDWDGFVPATNNRLARLSTGERSVALHLPMLASVAAHYDGLGTADAPSRCPRLILLDELFAGVDVANRGQLFGLFVAWDLDAVVTSDHEWCAYASLDGIAIHHLHAAEPGEPVTTSRFVWDGAERRAAPLAVVGR